MITRLHVLTLTALVANAGAYMLLPAPLSGGIGRTRSLRTARPGATSSLNMKIGVFYGTTTGNTENVATQIAEALGAEAKDIGSVEASSLAGYDTLVVGAPTWHTGADTERSGTDWDALLYGDIPGLELKDKKIAFFGCGDSESYGDNFCDAMGELYDQFAPTGAQVIGFVPVEESISFVESKAVKDGKMCGLACDEDNYYDESAPRIAKWAEQLVAEGAA